MTIKKLLAVFYTGLALTVGAPNSIFAAPTGVLVIAENETPENLDPANATNSTVNQLLVGVYDTLVQFTAGETAVCPRIAENWSVSDDGLSYTFKLRDEVVFHDGNKLSAHDIKFLTIPLI